MRKKVFLFILLFIMILLPNTYAKENNYTIVSGDLYTINSEICFGDDCFYVIANDGNILRLLAKNNITQEDKPVQSADAEGISFTDEPYWGETERQDAKYVYNSKSNLYKFVDAYKRTLIEKGVFVENARLVNQEELYLCGVDVITYTWPSSALKCDSNFWGGVAYNNKQIWTSELEQAEYRNSYFGIRPVLEIPVGWFNEENTVYMGGTSFVKASDGVASNNVSSIDLTFNDLGQYAKFETIIYNDTDEIMYVNDVNVEGLSESYVNVVLDDNSKNKQIEAGGASLVSFYVKTRSEEGAGKNLDDEVKINFLVSNNIVNPDTFSNNFEFLILIVILSIVIVCISNIFKNKKICFLTMIFGFIILGTRTVFADEYLKITVLGNIEYKSLNILETTGTILNDKSADYSNSKDVWAYYDKVKNIYVKSLVNVPKKYFKKFDLTLDDGNRVIAYLVENGDKTVPYDLFIMSNGVVIANEDSSFLFSFSNLESIEGIENIDFRSTISMKGMFVGNNKLKSVNIKALDMTNTKDTSFMFYDCKNLKFSENDFNLDNVEEKNLMFNQYLYNVIKKDSISDADYNYVRTQPPSGKILINTTKDDKFPIYYYRSEVNDNNVKFANFCWHMVRTTDTGGIKLIYNGIPASDGSCNNTGVNSTIGNSKIAASYDQPTYMGYMYGDKYNVKNYGYTMVGQVIVGHNITAETKYYYAKDVVYQSGVYHLQEPTLSRWADKYTEPVGYYTCASDTETSCKYVYYIVGALEDKFYSGTMSNGTMGEDKKAVFYKDYTISNGKVELLDKVEIPLIDFYNSYENYTGYYCDSGYIYNMSAGGYSVDAGAFWMFGKDYKYENGKYVLKDTYYPKTGYSKEYSTIGNDYRYTCFNESGECTNLYYAITIKPGNIVSILLSNGDGINEAYNKMYAQVNNSDIKTMLDNWYKNNMVNYTLKLEDTIWYNDKTYYGPLQGNGEVSSINANNTYTGHASCSRKYMAVPVLKYYNDNDKYTVSDDIGNGALTYPVGLITYDELAYGYNGCYISESTSYLNIGYAYWTMTPFTFDTYAYYAALNTSGKVEKKLVNSNLGVRPMISLKHDAEYFGGNGTVTNPYVVE